MTRDSAGLGWGRTRLDWAMTERDGARQTMEVKQSQSDVPGSCAHDMWSSLWRVCRSKP
jgi:hypothetical protein